MARTEGTQNIPSELLDLYRATLVEQTPELSIQKRLPYRLPNMQAGGADVKASQVAQRNRFKLIRDNFNALPEGERERWYAAMPPWSSFLWYYNYFIMSGLTGNANISEGGAGVIKSIQVMKASCPTTGGHTFTLPVEVDGDKTVVMLYGSARKVPRVLRGSGSVAAAGSTLALGGTVDPDKCTVKLFGANPYEAAEAAWVNVQPYVFSLTTTQITIKWSVTPTIAATVSWEVAEHVEGAVWPVLVSISDTQVAVDWAEAPDAASDVSIIAIEYI